MPKPNDTGEKKKKSAINCLEEIIIQQTQNLANYSLKILHIWGRARLNSLSQMLYIGEIVSAEYQTNHFFLPDSKRSLQIKPCSEHLGLCIRTRCVDLHIYL